MAQSKRYEELAWDINTINSKCSNDATAPDDSAHHCTGLVLDRMSQPLASTKSIWLAHR